MFIVFLCCSKLCVVSTPVYVRKHGNKSTMPRHASSAAVMVHKPSLNYRSRHRLGSEYTTSGEEGIAAGDQRRLSSRHSSSERTGNLIRVKSLEVATRSRQSYGPSLPYENQSKKHHVNRHESRERNKPSRKTSIDPKLRNQIIQEAVRKARERQLSRNRDLSKSRSQHRSESVQNLKKKSNEMEHKVREDHCTRRRDSKSPMTRIHSSRESPVVPRDRTPDDIEEWLRWRCYLNHQLSVYITQGNNSRASIPVDIMSVPEKLNKDTRGAIWSHAQKEKPKTSLDSNAYIVYGIPRARLKPHGPNFQISNPVVPNRSKVSLKRTQDENRPMSPEKGVPESSDTGCNEFQDQKQHVTGPQSLQSVNTDAPVSPKQMDRVVSSPSDKEHNAAKSPQLPTKVALVGMLENSDNNRISRPVSPMVKPLPLPVVGPANLREMYKKPFLRSLSEQSSKNSSAGKHKPVFDLCHRNALERYLEERPTSSVVVEGSERCGQSDHDSSRPASTMCKFPSPKTIDAKRVSSLVRTNSNRTTKTDASQSRNSYVNVPQDVTDQLSQVPFVAPPTPPPLPPKSFHFKK